MKKGGKKKRGDDEEDDDFNPNRPDDFEENDPIEDQLSIEDESDDEGGEKYVERQFNFVSEISIFVDYSVISKYLYVVKDKDYNKNPMLLKGVVSLFKRITNQVKAAWIFFQFEYMLIFQQILNEGHTNNPLMKNFTFNAPVTTRERQVQELMSEFKQILINIVRQYLDVFARNKMLGIECFFRFTSREHKDSILNNYESLTQPTAVAVTAKQAEESEEEEYQDRPDEFDEDEQVNDGHKKHQLSAEENLKKIWTQD